MDFTVKEISAVMAVLKQQFTQAQVDTLSGAIDFYYWKGLPVARKWPHWPARVPYPAEKATQERFGYCMRMWAFLPSYLQAQYRNMAVSTGVTGRDIFARAYLNAARI